MTDVLLGLRDAFPVNPWLGLLWFSSAVALGGLVVYGWRRLLGPPEGLLRGKR
jgi:hypothetical protein